MAAELVHSTAFVGEGVQLGSGARVGPHVVLLGPCTIGANVFIGAGACIGGPPEISSLRQNPAWTGDLEHQGVQIGDDVVIRDLVVIHQGSRRPTRIGSRSWLLNSSYVAHDVQVGEDVVLSAGVKVGGHALIGARANLGMNAMVHQGRAVGPGVMVGMGTPVTSDVPPFARLYGMPPRIAGVNSVLLQRLGHSTTLAEALSAAYRTGDMALRSLATQADAGAIAAELAWWDEVASSRPAKAAVPGNSTGPAAPAAVGGPA